MTDILDHSLAPEIEAPAPAKAPREPTLWITDAELIRRLGVPEKIAYETLRRMDGAPALGFPQKQKLWGNRRYWPAVKAYFDAKYAVNSGPSTRGSR